MVNYKYKNTYLLSMVYNQLKKEFNITPCIGAELEFFLSKNHIIKILQQKIGLSIKKEKGNNQFEINIPPSTKITQYPYYIKYMRKKIINYSFFLGSLANFDSKPFDNDYGNSMHIHLSFIEKNINIEKYAQILCHYTQEFMNYYLPTRQDYNRLDKQFMAPTHISYGYNNRTVLIRIINSNPQRLEYRLASASANPIKVIYAILYSLLQGLRNPQQITPIKATYGNAFDPQYKLKKITTF